LANRPFAVFSSTNPKGQMSCLASLSIRLYIKVGKKRIVQGSRQNFVMMSKKMDIWAILVQLLNLALNQIISNFIRRV
jgi:hypothetical protein